MRDTRPRVRCNGCSALTITGVVEIAGICERCYVGTADGLEFIRRTRSAMLTRRYVRVVENQIGNVDLQGSEYLAACNYIRGGLAKMSAE